MFLLTMKYCGVCLAGLKQEPIKLKLITYFSNAWSTRNTSFKEIHYITYIVIATNIRIYISTIEKNYKSRENIMLADRREAKWET